MTSRLEALVGRGIEREPADRKEFEGLKSSGLARLADARNVSNSLTGRFDLAYNAAHSLALAALRYRGYRAQKRYIVFQLLEETLGIEPKTWRVLDKSHSVRNAGEYEGEFDIDQRLLSDLIEACGLVAVEIERLPSLR